MPHIHTEPGQHDHTVSAFVVRKFEDGKWRILLHVHKKLGTLMQFGGHIELSETPWQALTHEISEEAGYDINDLELILSPPKIGILGAVEGFVPFSINTHPIKTEKSHFHTDSSYAFIAKTESSLSLADGESRDLRWLTKQEILELSDKDIISNVKQISLHVLNKVDT